MTHYTEALDRAGKDGAFAIFRSATRGLTLMIPRMSPEAERYKADANATFEAVLKWKRMHPKARPKLPPDNGGAACIGNLQVVVKHVQINESGHKLAAYVAENVPRVTWLMFYVSWLEIYGKSRRYS